MSANRLKNKESGFTLIEVTLAIVIGVVVIAGATVLYNQAKNSAANSAAQGKVNAAAAVIEEFSAKNFGQYPTAAQFSTIWQRTREDVGSNPWGGLAGTPTGGTVNIAGLRGYDTLTAVNAASAADTTLVGVLEYQKSTNTNPISIFDMQREATVSVRHYGLWIYNAEGRGPNFVVGGK